jgi:protoheme IX farnesyltransferase
MIAGLRLLGQLTKFRLSLIATCSCLGVFVLASDGVSWRLLPLVTGMLLTACGACALNQYQERELDGLMERTRGRPIPSGRMGPGEALGWSLAFLGAGLLTLVLMGTIVGAGLAALAVVWYNGVYTPLKRVTAFAAVPGGLVGVLPPAIGWVAAGRPLWDWRLAAFAFFFWVWQVPHFWSLVLIYGRQYERAGLPSLSQHLSQEQIARLVFAWTIVTAVSCLLLPLFGVVGSYPVLALLALGAVWLAWKAAGILGPRGSFRSAFVNVNLFAALVILLMALDPYLTL